MDEPLRLGGMALANGVLVHGPTSWAAAVRLEDGSVKVASERKRLRADDVQVPLLRGPLRRVGVLPLRSAVASRLVARAPLRARPRLRVLGQVLSLGVATETFGWMTRHPSHPVARALSKPGHELQHRLSTSEPTAAQLEVAEAALAACLEREADAA